MKILLNTPPLEETGGVANFYSCLRNYLKSEVVYFIIGKRGKESPWLSLFRLMADYIRFIGALCRSNFDIIHLNPSLLPRSVLRDAVFIIIARAFSKKTVVFIHGWNKEYERSLRHHGMCFLRMTFLHADAIIVLASEFQRSLQLMGYTGPIYVMTTTFDDALLPKDNVQRIWIDAKESFNILFLSRIELQKGIIEALQSLALIQSVHPNVHMTIAGTGSALEEARHYVRDNDIHNVDFLGYIRGEKKARAYLQAHCYLFPTNWGEGMPITIVEAMAFGLPVITRPVGAIADFFRDGEMGFLTESMDPMILAKLVERLLLAPELCERISDTNREYAMHHFSAHIVADRLRSIYQSIMKVESVENN
jgi:glycosyltransferase involved in cell wall biosynthesis